MKGYDDHSLSWFQVWTSRAEIWFGNWWYYMTGTVLLSYKENTRVWSQRVSSQVLGDPGSLGKFLRESKSSSWEITIQIRSQIPFEFDIYCISQKVETFPTNNSSCSLNPTRSVFLSRDTWPLPVLYTRWWVGRYKGSPQPGKYFCRNHEGWYKRETYTSYLM